MFLKGFPQHLLIVLVVACFRSSIVSVCRRESTPTPARSIPNLKFTSSVISGAEATLSSTEIIGVRTAADSSVICQPTIQVVSYRPARTLGRPLLANVAATLLVPVYRLISIVILSAILLGLASYLFLTVFY